jgi:hypothetical protein
MLGVMMATSLDFGFAGHGRVTAPSGWTSIPPMLHRLQSTARRWPRLCLALVLLAFSSQSVAVALDWCLDTVGGSHVGNVFAPCGERHGEAGEVADAGQSGAAAAQGPAASHHCHGTPHDGAPGHTLHHVAASSDAASPLAAPVVALPVSACWQFLPRFAMLDASGAGTALPRRAATALATPRPRLSGAIPGASSRLLI